MYKPRRKGFAVVDGIDTNQIDIGVIGGVEHTGAVGRARLDICEVLVSVDDDVDSQQFGIGSRVHTGTRLEAHTHPGKVDGAVLAEDSSFGREVIGVDFFGLNGGCRLVLRFVRRILGCFFLGSGAVRVFTIGSISGTISRGLCGIVGRGAGDRGRVGTGGHHEHRCEHQSDDLGGRGKPTKPIVHIFQCIWLPFNPRMIPVEVSLRGLASP